MLLNLADDILGLNFSYFLDLDLCTFLLLLSAIALVPVLARSDER